MGVCMTRGDTELLSARIIHIYIIHMYIIHMFIETLSVVGVQYTVHKIESKHASYKIVLFKAELITLLLFILTNQY